MIAYEMQIVRALVKKDRCRFIVFEVELSVSKILFAEIENVDERLHREESSDTRVVEHFFILKDYRSESREGDLITDEVPSDLETTILSVDLEFRDF
jgi:hypothetical protein